MSNATQSRKVVLVVEDEPLVRILAVDGLEEAGFEVLESANADQALATLAERDDIDVLFTDINMPGEMDGLELASEVHHRWPSIDVIVTSGLVAPRATDMPDGGRFIGKPYDPGQVAAAVQGFTR